MRLDITHCARLYFTRFKRGTNNRLLRRSIGCSEATAASVLIDSTAADNSEDTITVSQGITESTQHNGGAAFASYITVRRGVEHLAPAVRCHHPRLREINVHLGRQNDIDACQRARDRIRQAVAPGTLDGGRRATTSRPYRSRCSALADQGNTTIGQQPHCTHFPC